ncbi:Fungalysin/Thermolysin Extracellular metalloproteinase 5 [Phlyctochytrium planicorne]|nr:Fungalysin/Thermolysin Extracellular metalloproteinase 5 [Phlyctochytrium planicorne]
MRIHLFSVIVLLATCSASAIAAPARTHSKLPSRIGTPLPKAKPQSQPKAHGQHAENAGDSKHETTKVRAASSLKMDASNLGPFPRVFSPPTKFSDVVKSNAVPNHGSPEDIAKKYVALMNKILPSDLQVTASSKSESMGITHVYLVQTFGGVPISNLVHNVNIDSSNNIVSSGISKAQFNPPAANLFSVPISPIDAVGKVATALGFKSQVISQLRLSSDGKTVMGAPFEDTNVKVSAKLFYLPNGQIDTVWDLEVRAKSDAIDSLADGTDLIVDPVDMSSSPQGWHNNPLASGEIQTSGNNANAYNNDGVITSINKAFDFNYDQSTSPSWSSKASAVNIWYMANKYHDILYKYGFTESAGNFQNNNFGQGGAGSDAVALYAQDSSGSNNAYFLTRSDGQVSEAHFFITTYSNPNRDTGLDNGVVAHEYTHGLSTRLTGGPVNVNCLTSAVSGSMGEGWSDAVAFWMSMKSTDNRYTNKLIGKWSFNFQNGIRSYPYSTSTSTNRHFYSDVSDNVEVHAGGEVWATMLYEVFWNMVDQAGYEPDITQATSIKGNIRFMQNLVNGLKLQPCNPTFVDARDAFIQADKLTNNGAFNCAIWRAFAKRGLGYSASSYSYWNAYDLPSSC